MTKYTEQDVIEEKGREIFFGSLDPNFFLITDFGLIVGKDKYPDIDGLIRLRDGNGNYLNKYLHYQLRSKGEVRNNKYFCDEKTINYLISTNVPTLLFVVDVRDRKIFWYFLDYDIRRALNLQKDNKGRTFDLKDYEVKNNSLELNYQWQEFAKVDDYRKLSDSLNKIVSDFQRSVIKCVGLLYLLQKVSKKQLAGLFNKILEVNLDEVNVIIKRLDQESIITSTVNFYLLENEQLGIESLFELLNDLNLETLESMFKGKKERAIILRQLAKIEHPIVSHYFLTLAKELFGFIKQPTNNDEIFINLELLEEYVYRVPEQALRIIRVIINSKNPLQPTKKLYKGFGVIEGKSHNDLVIKCVELLNTIRYLKPKETFNLLIKLSSYPNKEVKEKALKDLSGFCEYDFRVLQKIGYGSQLLVLKEVERWDEKELVVNIEPLLEIAEELLKPSFGGHSVKDYKTFTFHFGPLNVTGQLKDIRKRTIALLQKVYSLSNDLKQQKRILQVLGEATQTPSQGIYGADMEQMVLANTSDLIDYYIQILLKADNEIIKDIEEQKTWFIRRFKKDKLPKIGKLESMIASKTEYEMFKVFVGHDFRFSEDLNWHEAEETRKKKIQEFIRDISWENFEDWQKKILFVVKSYPISEPGEFQYFNIFLNELGKQKPKIAFKLLTEKENELEPFLIHLIAGMWKSRSPEIAKDLFSQWVDDNKHLSVCAYVFDYVEEIDKPLLEKIFKKAKNNKDVNALNNIIRSIVRNYPKYKNLKPLFINTIKELTKNNNWWWINNVWYRGESILKSLTEKDFEAILGNLILVPNIDYHAEGVLTPIAEKYPKMVINFFHKRVVIKPQRNKRDNGRYNAIPFNLHKLGEILRTHERIIIPMILEWHREEEKENKWLFRWEASYLLKKIFPQFSPFLEKSLIDLIEEGDKRSRDIVLSVLSKYKGEEFLWSTVRTLVNKYARTKEYEKIQGDLFGYLSQTGVVSGEYGFVEAHKRKKENIQKLKKDKSKYVRLFVESYEKFLDQQIAYEQKRADEEIELRKKGLE